MKRTVELFLIFVALLILAPPVYFFGAYICAHICVHSWDLWFWVSTVVFVIAFIFAACILRALIDWILFWIDHAEDHE